MQQNHFFCQIHGLSHLSFHDHHVLFLVLVEEPFVQ
jgi:hypothetical protein